jgi:hypothetical protein
MINNQFISMTLNYSRLDQGLATQTRSFSCFLSFGLLKTEISEVS